MITVYVSADLSLWLDIVPCYGHPDTKTCPPIPSRLFPVPPGREVRYGCANYNIGVIISRTVENRG